MFFVVTLYRWELLDLWYTIFVLFIIIVHFDQLFLLFVAGQYFKGLLCGKGHIQLPVGIDLLERSGEKLGVKKGERVRIILDIKRIDKKYERRFKHQITIPKLITLWICTDIGNGFTEQSTQLYTLKSTYTRDIQKPSEQRQIAWNTPTCPKTNEKRKNNYHAIGSLLYSTKPKTTNTLNSLFTFQASSFGLIVAILYIT